MAAGNPNVTINVLANTQQATQGLNSVRTAMAGVATSANKATADMSGLGDSFSGITGKLTSLVAAYVSLQGAVSAVRAIINVNTEYSTSMAKARAVTEQNAGFTEAAFKGMQAEARRLGAVTVFSAGQAAEGLMYLGMAGFSAQQATEALEGTLRLAQAGNLDLGQSADIVSNVMSAFGASTQETIRYVNVLAKTAATSNNSVEMLGESMKYAAPIAAGLGMTVEQTAGAFGILGSAGIQAGTSGAGLRMVLSQLAREGGPTVKVLKGLGLTYEQLNPQTNTLVEIFRNLSNAGVDVTGVFGAFDARAANVAQVLVQNIDALETYTQRVTKADGAAAKMSDTMDKTFQGSILRMESAIEEAGLSLGDTFIPYLQEATEEFSAFVNELTESGKLREIGTALGEGMTSAIDAIKMIGSAFNAVASAPEPLKLALKATAVLWLANKIAASTFVTAVSARMGTLLFTIQGLRMRLASSVVHFNVLRASGTSTFSAIGGAATAAGISIKGAMISTGVGALIVAVGMLIEHFMSLADAANAAAEKVNAVQENATEQNIEFNVAIDEATTTEQLSDVRKRIVKRMSEAQKQLQKDLEATDDGTKVKVTKFDGTVEEVSAKQLLIEQNRRELAMLQSQLEQIDKKIPLVEQQIKKEKELEEQLEKNKQLTEEQLKAKEKLLDVTGENIKDEGKTEMDKKMDEVAPAIQRDVILRVKGFSNMEQLDAELSALTNKRLVSGDTMDTGELERLKELQEAKKELVSIGEEEEQNRKATEDVDEQLAILRAKVNGEEELAEKLQKQYDIRRKTIELEKAGVEDAGKKAAEMVEAEAALSKKKEEDKVERDLPRGDSNLTVDSLQAIGGGGGSFGTSTMEGIATRTADATEKVAENTAALVEEIKQSPFVTPSVGNSNGSTSEVGSDSQSTKQNSLLSSILDVIRKIHADMGNRPTQIQIS